MADTLTTLGSRENTAEIEHPIAEIADALTVLSEQTRRWWTDLAKAQDQVRSLSELKRSRDAEARRERGGLTVVQASTLVAELLREGGHRIAYVRPGGTPLLSWEGCEAFWADPRITVRELVSQPTDQTRGTFGADRDLLRTIWTELREVAIVDDTLALIPAVAADGSTRVEAVREPVVVHQMAQFFNTAWTWAEIGHGHVSACYGPEADVKSRIVLLLAQGVKDETVARRLGISLRTCRRHVAEILERLNSSSRFQAGMRVALLGALPAQIPHGKADTPGLRGLE